MSEYPEFEKLMNDLSEASEAAHGHGESYNSEAIDAAMDILHMVHSWARAYPRDIFPEMTAADWDEHHRLLGAAKRSGSASAADCMRYVVEQMGRSMEKIAGRSSVSRS